MADIPCPCFQSYYAQRDPELPAATDKASIEVREHDWTQGDSYDGDDARDRPTRPLVRRAHSVPSGRSAPSPAISRPVAASRTLRIRFIDASYLQGERRFSTASPSFPSNSVVEDGQGWSPRRRRTISSRQLEKLLEVFEQVDTPSFDIRNGLSAELAMTPREIQIWFQNRRAKVRRKREAGGGGRVVLAARLQATEGGAGAVVGGRERERAGGGPSTNSSSSPLFEAPSDSPADSEHFAWAHHFGSPFSFHYPAPGLPIAPGSSTEEIQTGAHQLSHSSTTSGVDSGVPRYRKIVEERRISLPTTLLGLVAPSSSSASTISSNSTSYFPRRTLPSPSHTSPSLSTHSTLSSLPASPSPRPRRCRRLSLDDLLNPSSASLPRFSTPSSFASPF